METISEMTEQEMRETTVPQFNDIDDLIEYLNKLKIKQHDYGTCCYAVSMAAVATFNWMSDQLGITGFQASCADLDIIRRTRHIKGGFRILKYEDLLYPQYCDDEYFPTWRDLIKENKEWLREEAKKKLSESSTAHPNVIHHWEYLANL